MVDFSTNLILQFEIRMKETNLECVTKSNPDCAHEFIPSFESNPCNLSLTLPLSLCLCAYHVRTCAGRMDTQQKLNLRRIGTVSDRGALRQTNAATTQGWHHHGQKPDATWPNQLYVKTDDARVATTVRIRSTWKPLHCCFLTENARMSVTKHMHIVIRSCINTNRKNNACPLSDFVGNSVRVHVRL